MSDPMTMLYIAGMVLGAKTALEGLQEGNLTKAIIGGVSAYFGASGLMGGTAAASTGALAGETAGASTMATGIGVEMGNTAMTGFGDLAGATFTPAAPAAASIGGVSEALNAGTSLMDTAGLTLASSGMTPMNTSLSPSIEQSSSLLDPAGTVNAPNGDMGMSETMTAKVPNVKMGGDMKLNDNNIFADGQESLSNMWDSAKEGATQLGEFAKDNPFMTQQMVGSGMQLLAGDQANDTAEEIAEKREAWEREQQLLSSTPANIYFDGQGVARDQYGKPLAQGV